MLGVFTPRTAPSVRPAAGSRSCGGERSHSWSGRRAAGACSVRAARAGRAPGETEGTSGAVFLERERRGRAGARGEHRLERGGDMRTYWLHSVWVLGFFLSLFSLQGKEGRGWPRPLAPPPVRRRARGWVGVSGMRSARNVDGTRFIYKSCGALPALARECADRLAALALLMGRFGTGVCVRVHACVRLCVCVCWRG